MVRSGKDSIPDITLEMPAEFPFVIQSERARVYRVPCVSAAMSLLFRAKIDQIWGRFSMPSSKGRSSAFPHR